MNYKADDKEVVDCLIRHIENPGVELQTGLNIREFYIREAERAIRTFGDPIAKKMLREYIQKYAAY